MPARVGRVRPPDIEPEVLGTASGEIVNQYLSSAKAREVLGWAPAHGLDAGLVRTVEWYRGHLGHAASLAA